MMTEANWREAIEIKDEMINRRDAEITRLRAEVERLRQELGSIAKGKRQSSPSPVERPSEREVIGAHWSLNLSRK